MSEAGHGVIPIKVYLGVFAALLVGTALTVWVALFDLGPMSTVVALAIAVTKATLVVLYFMHVRYATRLTALVVVAATLWLVVLLAFTMADYLSRDWGAGRGRSPIESGRISQPIVRLLPRPAGPTTTTASRSPWNYAAI